MILLWRALCSNGVGEIILVNMLQVMLYAEGSLSACSTLALHVGEGHRV